MTTPPAHQPSADHPPAAHDRPDDRGRAPLDWPDLLARLDAEIAYLRAALEREQTASAELRRIAHLAQQQLTAPPAENRPAPAAPARTPAAPWWAFWRR